MPQDADGRHFLSKRRALTFLLSLLLAAIAGVGSLRFPTAPVIVPPTGRAQPLQVLRIASFNIHSGIGSDGKLDLGRIADTLRGFDFVGLNEVAGAWHTQEDQASLLSRSISSSSLFAPTEWRWYHQHFGNGLLYSCDIDGYERIPLESTLGRGKRNLVRTRISLAHRDGQTTSTDIFLTHIDREADRVPQLAAVAAIIAQTNGPAILMGDLNSSKTDPAIVSLLAKAKLSDLLSDKLQSRDPPDRIDYILIRGLHPRDAGLKPGPASDHPLVWAEVELEK